MKQEVSEKQPYVDFGVSDLCAAFLNGKLDILSLQEKVAIGWHSGKWGSCSHPWIYFEAGQFRPANRDDNSASWEENVYEKSMCQGVEYDAETTEMIKCMLNDKKKYVDKIRNRIEKRKRQQSIRCEEEIQS